MRIIFVRHGEPDYANDCLTENGREQAQSTAKRLHAEKIDAIYASPMGRAQETASYTAQDHGLDIATLDFMHEIDWGNSDDTLEYGGHPWTLANLMVTEDPSYAVGPDWDKHHYFKDNICLEYYHMISERIDGFLREYGLSRENGLYVRKRPVDDTIALFAHGGSGAVLFSHILNLPFPFVLTAMTYGVCSVSVLSFKPERPDNIVIPRLELFNDMGHIDRTRLETLRFEK